MILTKIIVSSVSDISLIAIEEPENSVHPGLFQAYIQIISQLLDDCKVIITSHSPYIISYLDPSWIYVGMNKKPGVAEFFAFKKLGQKQLENDAAAFLVFVLLDRRNIKMKIFLMATFFVIRWIAFSLTGKITQLLSEAVTGISNSGYTSYYAASYTKTVQNRGRAVLLEIWHGLFCSLRDMARLVL